MIKFKNDRTGNYVYGELQIGIIKFSWRNIGIRKFDIRVSISWGWT